MPELTATLSSNLNANFSSRKPTENFACASQEGLARSSALIMITTVLIQNIGLVWIKDDLKAYTRCLLILFGLDQIITVDLIRNFLGFTFLDLQLSFAQLWIINFTGKDLKISWSILL